MSEKLLNKFLVALLILILLGGGAFALYLLQSSGAPSTNEVNEEAIVDDCSEMNGWWDTGYHEFTITAPIVKNWNGMEGTIEKDDSGLYLYKITFTTERDGYKNYSYLYIRKNEDKDAKTEYILTDSTDGGNIGYPLYKKNDD